MNPPVSPFVADERQVPVRSPLDRKVRDVEVGIRDLVATAMHTGKELGGEIAELRHELMQQKVDDELAGIAVHLKSLLELADNLPKKKSKRRKVEEVIRAQVVKIALHAATIKKETGVDHANSNQAQTAGEEQASETAPQEGADEQGGL